LKRFFLFHFLFPFLLCAQAFNHKGIGLVNEIDQSLVFWTDRLSCHTTVNFWNLFMVELEMSLNVLSFLPA
jgi:hypothetical protein